MIKPGSTIGILGGGQLGRMLAIAAAGMGYHAHIYCPEKNCPASEVAKYTTVAGYDNIRALKKFAKSVDVITYEFENIPAAPLTPIAKKIRPSLNILETCQHRLLEKQTLNKIGIATAPFAAVHSQKDLEAAIKKIGLPAVLKTATMGYDGKGQWIIRHPRDLSSEALAKEESGDPGLQRKWPKIPAQGGDDDLILESFIPFSMEISVIVARGTDGKIACYPPVQNIHKHHILSETIAPAPISRALAKKASTIACDIAKGMRLVGLMAVEMFVVSPPISSPLAGGIKGEEILVNELAPRPHNSGHWTIDACPVSQFEQTIRAVCGLPLGLTKPLCKAKMINLIGEDMKQWEKYLKEPNARMHLYGKKETRPGRKMGHVTFLTL